MRDEGRRAGEFSKQHVMQCSSVVFVPVSVLYTVLR